MSKKLNCDLKYFKRQIQRIKLKWRNFRHALKYQRGAVVCRCVNFIFVVATTAGALPFRVRNLENGFRQLIPVGRKRHAVIHGMQIHMILGAAFYALLPLSSKVQLVVNGKLTADCLIWSFSIAVAAASAIMSYELLQNHRDCAFLYNNTVELVRSATRKHLKGRHIFDLVDIHGRVLCWVAIACALSILTPVLATLVWFPLKDSPALIAYHIVGPYADIQDDDTLGVVLYWIASLIHWIFFNNEAMFCLTMTVILSEGVIMSSLVLKRIRYLKPNDIGWAEKLKLHAQAELILTVLNELAGFAAPVILLLSLILAVSCFITVMMTDSDAGFPSVALIPVLSGTGVGTLVSGCIFLKFAEGFRENSIGVLKEMEAEITAAFKFQRRRRRGKRSEYLPTGRSFRRRPIGIRLGIFMWMDEGIAVSYFMTIVDKTMNYFFMVDLRSHPVWLW